MAPKFATVLATLVVLLTAAGSPATATSGTERQTLSGVVDSRAANELLDGEMGQDRAGRYYLSLACASNDAVAKASLRIYGPDNRISHDEARRRLPKIKAATGPWAKSHYVFARAMLNPPAPWPSNVASLVDRSTSAHLRINTLLRRASSATSATQWISLTNRANKMSTPSATIRARLDLPPPGRGC